MKKIIFKSITEKNSRIFHSLMKEYAAELDKYQHRTTDPRLLERWTDGVIGKAAESFRILRLCYADDEVIGFLYGKIDQPNDKGYKMVGCGCIMEFYVKPEFRRKGYGKIMFNYVEQFFRKQNTAWMYLTADPVTGKPFWSALGFTSKGEYSPDNNQEIFEKAVLPEITG